MIDHDLKLLIQEIEKILIVGASGFIGNSLFKKLIKKSNYKLKGDFFKSSKWNI